ncbi:MAG: ribosomal protein S18-alanine N-acetyltransferase [Candidatus Brockarchaeota archaeon]|nr:ribosomal protein S18-alanine N-acetyltransferase [Candidatus Brockarchaeota archaeon]
MFEKERIVREAKEEDLETIVRLEKASFPKYSYPFKVFEELLMRCPKYFLVAEYNGRVSGYVCGRVVGKSVGVVVSIAVEPELRRRGIGRILMLELESRFREKHVKTVRLEVGVDNDAAIRLYESLGYETAGLRSKYYPDGSDALIMFKNL